VLDKPDAKDLLDAMAAFLINEVVPELQGRKRFHALVSANVARILARETELASSLQEREIERLTTLMGHVSAAELPASAADRDRLEAALAAELIRRIEAGDADDGPWAEQVFVYLKAMVADKLSIDNPKILRGAS
jgi:hypothetical protein